MKQKEPKKAKQKTISLTWEQNQKLKSDVIWAYTRSGAFQRAKIYIEEATDEDKRRFRRDTKLFLFDEVFNKFENRKITEKDLLVTIDKFIRITKRDCLTGNKLRFGNAQKFVNLYLKGMWVFGMTSAPPHFPVDRIILKSLKQSSRWTKMNRKEYKTVIKCARVFINTETDFKSLAEWEAIEYQTTYIDNR